MPDASSTAATNLEVRWRTILSEAGALLPISHHLRFLIPFLDIDARFLLGAVKDIVNGDISVTVDGAKADAKISSNGTLEVTVTAPVTATVEVTAENCEFLKNADKKQELTKTISKFQMSTDKKGMIYGAFIKNGKKMPKVAKEFREPLEEVINLW